MKQYNSTTLVRTIWSLLLALSALCLIPTTAEAQTTPQKCNAFEIVYPTGGWGTLRGRDALRGAPQPTGTLNISFQPLKQGTPPYKFEILEYPADYTGPKVLTSDSISSTIYGLPAGNYVLNVSDATGCTQTTKGLVKETTALQFFPEPFTQKFTSPDRLRWVGTVLNVGGRNNYKDNIDTLNHYFEYAICTQGEYENYRYRGGSLNWMPKLTDTGVEPAFTGDFGVWRVKVPERTSFGDTIIVEKPCLFVKLPDDGPSPSEMYARCAYARGAIDEMLSIAIRVKGSTDPKYSEFANHFYGGFEGAQTFDPNNWLEVIGGGPSPCDVYKPTIRIKEEWAKKLTFPVTLSVRNRDNQAWTSPEMLYMTFTKDNYMIPQEFQGGHMSPGFWNRIYMRDSSVPFKDSSLGLKPNDTSGEPVIPGYNPEVYYRDTDTTRMWNEFSGWHPDLKAGKVGWDYCEGTVDKVLAIAVQERRWGRAYKSNLAGATFILVKAPEGYEEYRQQYKYFPKLNEPLVLPEKHQSDWFFPFASNDAPAENPYMNPCYDVKVPEGDYYWRIKFIDLCEEEKTLPTPTTEVQGPLWTSIHYNAIKYELENKGEDLKPQYERVGCDSLRVYPFRGAKSRNILLRNGEPARVYARAVQTTTNEYGYERFVASGTTSFDPADLNQKPEDQYIELPWRNSTIDTIEIQYNYEPIDQFTKIIPCFDLGMKFTIETTGPTYDRDQLYTYICPSGKTAYVSVLPIRTAGETLVELRDVKDVNKPSYASQTLASTDQGKPVVFNLTGEQVQPEYMLYIKTGSDDSDCPLDNGGEIIKMNDLQGSSFIIGANDTKYCVGDTIKLECPPITPESEYTWTQPDGTQHHGRKVTIGAATLPHSGKWQLEVTAVPCDGTPAPQTVPFILSVAPTELWWRKDAKSADWNSFDNWADSEGDSIKAVPARCTDVHLPSVVDKFYPNLDPKKTIREPLGEPVCNDIYFHFGSALGQPQLLTEYSRAFIDYNFGVVQPDGSIQAHQDSKHLGAYDLLLDRDRWYMIATPLKNVYAGDFSLGAYPLTYQRYLKVKQDGGELTEASFDKPITKQGRSMVAYNHALAYKVEGYHPEKLGAKDHTNLNGLQGIIRLPYYENKERAPFYPLHHYSKTIDRYRFDESTQKWVLVGSVVDPHSYFAYFDMKDLRPLTRVDSVKRDPALDYRFLFEDDKTGKIGKTKSYDKQSGQWIDVEGYTMKITSSSKSPNGSYVMIGNPFMSPIRSVNLLGANRENLEKLTLYIFTEGAWRYVGGGVGFGKQLKTLRVIAPLQSFVVKLKKGKEDTSEFYFPTKALQDPNSTYGKEAVLRSADEESDEITERYVAVTVTDAEGGYTSAVLLPEDTEESTPALMAPEGMQTAPLVYFISPTDSTCNFVQTNVPSAVVELGVFAPTDGMLTLDFTTLAEKPFDKLALYDRLRGTEQDLLVNPTFSYGYSERDGRRFELRMSYGNVRYDEQQDHQPDLAIERTATGYRISYDQGIAGYQLYSVHGYLLERATTDGQTQVDIEMPETDVVLLDVQSADGLRWIKKLQR